MFREGRKPTGKLVALLAGAVVVVLLAAGVMFWKDVYCQMPEDKLFEDSVGR